jgi:hypothetical protein
MFSPLEKLCGLANAIISNPTARHLKMNGKCLSLSFQLGATDLNILIEE